MLTDAAKAKVISALQPLYADSDFTNVKGDFFVSVVTEPVPVVTPPDDTEQVDIIKP